MPSLHELPAATAPVDRLLAELWRPYWAELERTVERFAVAVEPESEPDPAPDGDAGGDWPTAAHMADQREWVLEKLRETDYRVTVAVGDEEPGETGGTLGPDDGPDTVARPTTDAEDGLAATEAPWVGFVATDIDRAPPVFRRPDRVTISELYVREPSRGTGLAERLVDVARERAHTADCPELRLEVDADNGRARSFYERVGFVPARHELVLDLDLDSDSDPDSGADAPDSTD